MTSNYALVCGFEELIKATIWDLFLTISFRRETKSDLATKDLKFFFKYLNSGKFVPFKDVWFNAIRTKFFEKFVLCLVIFEKEGNRNGVHLHIFLKGIAPEYASLLEEECKCFFGDSNVRPYDAKKAARFYLSWKYVSSDLDDWNIFRINSRER